MINRISPACAGLSQKPTISVTIIEMQSRQTSQKFHHPSFLKLTLVALLSVFLITLFIWLTQPVSSRVYAQEPATFVFLRDLRVGVTGRDVLELQKILNRDPETVVSVAGAGSSGQETAYFGPATAQAVQRFQNKYANEVLRPAGLTQGSGFVGLWTRLKLNQIILNVSVAQIPTESTATTQAFSATTSVSASTATLPNLGSFSLFGDSKTLMVAFPSAYYGPAGTKLSISGSGFSLESNTVNFGRQKMANIKAKNANEISFLVPHVTPGKYDISVSNSGKTSDTVSFMVTNTGAVKPSIDKIEPAEAKFGQEIKITGKNFTPTGNMVNSALGIIQDLPSTDGKTIVFTIPLPDYLNTHDQSILQKWFGNKTNLFWPVRFKVINTNGISDTSAAGFIINI